jgi:hypothetical protein
VRSCNRVGHNRIYIRVYDVHALFKQRNYRTYGHIQSVYTVLANPRDADTASYWT